MLSKNSSLNQNLILTKSSTFDYNFVFDQTFDFWQFKNPTNHILPWYTMAAVYTCIFWLKDILF